MGFTVAAIPTLAAALQGLIAIKVLLRSRSFAATGAERLLAHHLHRTQVRGGGHPLGSPQRIKQGGPTQRLGIDALQGGDVVGGVALQPHPSSCKVLQRGGLAAGVERRDAFANAQLVGQLLGASYPTGRTFSWGFLT